MSLEGAVVPQEGMGQVNFQPDRGLSTPANYAGRDRADDDYDELRRAAVERVSTRKVLIERPKGKDTDSTERKVKDISELTRSERAIIVDKALESPEDASRFFDKLKARQERVGIDLAQVEVRFQNLTVTTSVYMGNRALPTVINSYRNFVEGWLTKFHLLPVNKRKFTILNDIYGIIPPGRITLLLGPPGAGKSTLLKALAGKLQKEETLKVQGSITYNGKPFRDFYPERTASYIDQNDVHQPELTVRETFDFAARCQGVGHKAEELAEIRRREKAEHIEPDWEVDAFMKAAAVKGKRESIVSELIIKLLGLDVCADTFIGNQMIRGVSGGQRKRVTTGEMIVGPKKTLFMDEISTGLDSSTTFQIVRSIRDFVHLRKGTVFMALLQPAPETYELFDDVMLLSEGHIVYHGPREDVLTFFESQGFFCPERKGVPDFLQEVTSRKDQGQYWRGHGPYKYVGVAHFAEAFRQSSVGRRNQAALQKPYQPVNSKSEEALITQKYALGPVGRFKALMRREVTLVIRTLFIYRFKTAQVAIMGIITATLFLRTHVHGGRSFQPDGNAIAGFLFFSMLIMLFNGIAEMSMTVERLPVFYKQRDNRFLDAFSFVMPATIMRLPYSALEAFVWTVLTYFTVGLAPDAGRFFMFMFILFLMHFWSVGLFRMIGALSRNIVVANSVGSLAMLGIFLMGGFVIAKPFIHPWVVWIYWANPLAYAQRAILINEFSHRRWQNKPSPYDPNQTLGDAVLTFRGFQTEYWWVWVGVGVLIGGTILFNFLLVVFHEILPPFGKQKAVVSEETLADREIALYGEEGRQAYEQNATRQNGAADSKDVAIEMGRQDQQQLGKLSESSGSGSGDAAHDNGTAIMVPAGRPADVGSHQIPSLAASRVASRTPSVGIPPAFDPEDYTQHPERYPNAQQIEETAKQHNQQRQQKREQAATAAASRDTPAYQEEQQAQQQTPVQAAQQQPANQGSQQEATERTRSGGIMGGVFGGSRRRGMNTGPPQASQNALAAAERQGSNPVSKRGSSRRFGSGTGSKRSMNSTQREITGKGMILPFEPMTMTFSDVHYFVEIPADMAKDREMVHVEGGKHMLELLQGISGAFRPGVLTSLMGVSGAGKTTLMDVLAGRKTGGRITGDIRINGHTKEQDSFARISGYVEQFDIHSSQTTVREALQFSAHLRTKTSGDVTSSTVETFIDEVMALVELTPLRDVLVGRPGESGLSVEQRKRLTIAVELVANPSIVFMDEPTSGLDARAAAIVMRTVRNIVNTGRTIVCTIHQPSIDIFESFDELLLLKRGGETIYNGKLGKHSADLVSYFSAVPGVPEIKEGLNPATWMLEVSTPGMEKRLGVDFAQIYKESGQAKRFDAIIKEYSQPKEGSQAIRFDTKYPKTMPQQFYYIFKKFMAIYWRTPEYNGVRFFFAVAIGLLFGAIFWMLGDDTGTQLGLFNVLGALYATTLFFGIINSIVIQPIMSDERAVSYREQAAGMYSIFPWAAAIGCVEIIYILVQSILYTVIVYFMCGFIRDAGKFFWFLLFMMLTLIYFTFYGIMAVAITPNIKVAAVLSSNFYALFNLFAGFVIQRPNMPGWWVWYYYIDPVAWTVYGLITSQVGDVRDLTTLPTGEQVPIDQFVRSAFGYRHDWLGYVVLILIGWCIFFWLLSYLALKKLNFLKR